MRVWSEMELYRRSYASRCACCRYTSRSSLLRSLVLDLLRAPSSDCDPQTSGNCMYQTQRLATIGTEI